MTEEEVKDASCQILSHAGSGTGWLISAEHVLTALHCVQHSSEGKFDPITVRFGAGNTTEEIETTVVGFDAGLDICLLRLSSPSTRRAVPLATSRSRTGERWFAFGYPVVKLQLGHVVQGVIQQTLKAPIHGIDLDLSIDPLVSLSGYEGLSGAALMVDDACQGIVRVSVDNTLGAVSSERLQEFLSKHGLSPTSASPTIDLSITGARPQFDELFTDCLRMGGSGYVLLDGAHGIGKSTYCRNFAPNATDIDVLGVYAFSDRTRGSTPAHQAQPEIFFDWLNSLRSERSTGRPARLTEFSYPQLIQRTNQILQALATECTQSGKHGVLFIDGANEADKVGGDALRRFIGLLPNVLPPGLKIVITGVGLEALVAKLGDITTGAKRLTLPVLGTQAQADICLSALQDDRATPALINLLCDRALGHPLYLRYLLDLVNGGVSDEELKTLPAFSGAIEDFYETIWAQLLTDGNVVNLLGIIVRLRWGVPVAMLMPLLTPSESAAYIPTLARIRHLLSSPEQTEIYHPSFSEFITHKTSTSGEWVHGRLAEFCTSTASGEYGVLNKVYHGLLGDRSERANAMKTCDQSWVDQSVLLEVEPDLLLSDIDDALAAATREGTAVDIIRLLLLSQRLTFRYNTLFAQSAELVAQALISLGKTDHAQRHILRYGKLIVGPDEAFGVVRGLIVSQRYDEARKVLAAVDLILSTELAADKVDLENFVQLAQLKIHGYVLATQAEADPPTFEFLKYIRNVIEDPRNDLTVDQRQRVMQAVVGGMLGATLCLQGLYKPIAKIPMPAEVTSWAQAMSLIAVLQHASMYSRMYGIRLPEASIKQLLADIDEKLDDTLLADQRNFDVVDALINVGASPELVRRYADGIALNADNIPLFTKSRALADYDAFDTAYQRLRASYFMCEQLIKPVAQPLDPCNWEESMSTLARAVAWHDGNARRAHGLGDVAGVNAAQKDLETDLLPVFQFSLESRIDWEESYFLPEHVIPWLYQRLAQLYLDCFTDGAEAILDVVSRGFVRQLGLYNEGFRRALICVIVPFVEAEVRGPIADKVFDLLIAWRDYILENVQNRHELVPELLHIVSLLVRASAPEEALRTYESVLAISMGPGWYKEDQLSLMSEVLSALPPRTTVEPSALARVAAYLERATGEMTFRRYVRADKGAFIGELFRRGLSADGVMYFQHQACGTTQQLLDQVSEGNLDRVSPFVGMRFPGGALEEQAALLQLLKNLNDGCNWRLRWALLETYQHGDDRHLANWGRAYAAIIKELTESPSNLAWACARLKTISCSMNREGAWLLLQALVSDLEPLAPEPLATLVEEVESSLSAPQLDRLCSSFGIRRRSPDNQSLRATTQRTDIAGTSPADPESEENVDVSMHDDESAALPGTFGRRSASREAAQAIETTRAHMRRRNSTAAIESCLAALKALQQGEWSIWEERHSADEADRILKNLVPDGDALARAYGPLALAERHVQRWRIAAKLIRLTSSGIGSESQTELLRVATDHVRQMVGEAPSDQFSYIGSNLCAEDTPSALELLLWALDHPSWERRDSAIAMLLWLLRSEDTWTKPLVRLMLSEERRHRADATAAALDILSRENAVDLWTRISPHLKVDTLPDQICHVGRFSVLLRIANRAGRQGVASASALARALEAKLQAVLSPLRATAYLEAPPYVPSSLSRLWRNLSELGVLDAAAVQRFNIELAAACAPLSIEEGYALELCVSNAFDEQMKSLGRWASRVRHALNVAIFPNLSLETLQKSDAILRVYNPESLVEPPDGQRPTSCLIDALATGNIRTYTPSDNDLVYLHVQCIVEGKRSAVHIELVPQLVQAGNHSPRPVANPAFRSTELPLPGTGEITAVCGRVFPTPAYFGSLTPAIATPGFLSLIGASAGTTLRYHWRDSSAGMSLTTSRKFEHSVLAVKRETLKLPSGWQLQWHLLIDGEHKATLNRY